LLNISLSIILSHAVMEEAGGRGKRVKRVMELSILRRFIFGTYIEHKCFPTPRKNTLGK
jgi:hypothetical protein